MRTPTRLGIAVLASALTVGPTALAETDGKVRVVTSLPDYAWVAERIGGAPVAAESIARGNQDAHFVRPKPSFQRLMQSADLFVTTGLDLELWVPALLDAAGNPKILEGAAGYVAAWPGLRLLDVPDSVSRAHGDIHIFGNPHIHTDPLNMALIGKNILAGLERVDPDRAAGYRRNEQAFEDLLYRRMFGDEVVKMLGGPTVARLARTGKLFSFLRSKEYPRGSGRYLIDRLGGWMKRAEPLRGKRIVAYHKNWVYFAERFGLEIAGYVETKPGIPATPRHVETILDMMRREKIQVILSSNYFDPAKPRTIAERTGAELVVVPLSTAGEPGVDDYLELIDTWIDRLLTAFDVDEEASAP